MLRLAKTSRTSNRVFRSIWPDLLLFKLPVLVAWSRIWTSHAHPCTWRCDGLAQCGSLLLGPVCNFGYTLVVYHDGNVWIVSWFWRFPLLLFLVLAYYSNFVLNECPSFSAVRHLANLEFFTIARARFFHAGQQGIVGFQFYNLQMGQSDCEILHRPSDVRRRVEHYTITALRHYSMVMLSAQVSLISRIILQPKSTSRS